MQGICAHRLVQEYLRWLSPERSHPDDDNSTNANALEKSQRFTEAPDVDVLVPKRPNHNYIRFQTDKFLFSCNLKAAAVVRIGRFDVGHRSARIVPADQFESKNSLVLQQSQPGD